MPLRFLPFLPRRETPDDVAKTLRVVVTGAECTGKSTLARALGEALGAPVVEEAARLYAEDHAPRPLGESDVEPIARLHLAQVENAEAERPELLLLDTDLVSTAVYARHLYGDDRVPAWLPESVEAERGDLYLLCTPEGVAWEPDPGQRAETDALRTDTHPAFADALGMLRWMHGTRVVTLTGSPEERLRLALHAIAAARTEDA